jgi:hypothetical protein
MATKNESKALETINAGGAVSKMEMASLLDTFVSDEENEITAEYMTLEVGESKRVWFLEMIEINSIEGAGKTPAARFLLPDGLYAINANAVVVSTCEKLGKATPLELICTGKKGPKGKEYFTFKIIQLMSK